MHLAEERRKADPNARWIGAFEARLRVLRAEREALFTPK